MRLAHRKEDEVAQSASTEQRLEAAGKSAAAKLRAFGEGLTPDEQQALDLALRRLGAQTDGAGADTAGYATPIFGMGLFAWLAAELDLLQTWDQAYRSQQSL